MTTSSQLSYTKKGLKLKDVFVLFHLRKICSSITLESFLKLNPLLGISDKSLRTIIKKLIDKNLLVSFKTATSLFFIFPFLRPVKNAKRLKFFSLTNRKKSFSSGKNIHLTYYKYNYLYNKLINNRHNVNISSVYINNINTKDLDDVIMYKENILKNKFQSQSNKQSFVVNKKNYNFFNVLKQKFKADFPNKNNYLTFNPPNNFNYQLFVKKIKESPFLSSKNNLGLSWMLKNYDAIINDQFAPFKEKTEQQGIITAKNNKEDFSQRTYTSEDLSHLLSDLSDIPLE